LCCSDVYRIIAKSGIIVINQFERGIIERWDAFAQYISEGVKKGYTSYSDSDWLNYFVYGTAMGVGLDVVVWGERLGIKLKEFTFYRKLYSLFDSLANCLVFKLPFIHRDVLG